MTRNVEENLQQLRIGENVKYGRGRAARESEPLREQKFPQQYRRYIVPNALYKKIDNKQLKSAKNKDLTSLNIPSALENAVNKSYVFQNQKQPYKHYKQPNQFNHKKLLSPKEQINNSILMIENILKNGIRPSLKEDIKSNQYLTKRGGRYSEPLEEERDKKQSKKPLNFLKKGSQQKNLISKKSLLDTMSSNHQRVSYSTKIQDFLYLKQLGRGKFGVVSLAIHKKTNFLYAIKAMSKRAIISENIVDQIIREVKIQHFINHSNIVKLYDIFSDSDHLYLIMEYCNGGQFYHILQKRRKIPEAEAKIYVREICNGVEELHKHGIIHRDLKPQNIVMSFGMIKICDFGWSVASKNCLRSTFCGTPLYVSPELLIGNDYNQKVDLWAIGIITYQMLTGQIPFKISTEKQLVKIIESNITYPSWMSVSAKMFIEQLLEKNPHSRATISQVLQHPFLINSPQQNRTNFIGTIRKQQK